MTDTQTIRDDILLAALPNVTFDGWTWDGICHAAENAGHSEAIVRGVFPENMISVQDHFADWADRAMLKNLECITPDDLRMRDRIAEAVMARLHALNPHKEAVKYALQFWLFPTRKLRAGKITWRSADVIWNWAGDTAQDYNHYTKRGLLCGVIASTTLAWLNDPTESLDQTRAFLDNRIENVMQLGKIIGQFKKPA